MEDFFIDEDEQEEDVIVDDDFYSYDELDAECEDGRLSAEEAAWMRGYLDAL